MSESNPLVERVDALLKRHQQQAAAARATGLADPGPVAAASPLSTGGVQIPTDPHAVQTIAADDDIPVLTEIVDPDALPAAGGRGPAEELEAAVLEKALAELDLALQSRLNRTIGEVLDQAMDGLRADLSAHVRQLVREAVADALGKAGTEPPRSP